VDVHDLGGGALLIVVGRDDSLIDAEGEGDQRRGREPRQQPVDQCKETLGIGKIDQGHRRHLLVLQDFIVASS
jgi:hypothetical protein